MKKVIFILSVIIYVSIVSCAAAPINNAVYHSMRAASYRNNYNSQVNNRVIPYWQAQSNYSTRNRIYSDYSHYNSNIYNYTNVRNNYRGYR